MIKTEGTGLASQELNPASTQPIETDLQSPPDPAALGDLLPSSEPLVAESSAAQPQPQSGGRRDSNGRRESKGDGGKRPPDGDDPKPLVTTDRNTDGWANNEANPLWGSAGATLLRLAPSDYVDGYSAPSGEDRPSPREISNAVAQQAGDMPNAGGFSDMLWAWGQFIDHDMDLTDGGTTESFPIEVPAGDPDFDPDGEGGVIIPFMRAEYDEETGTTDAREHHNAITAFLDASMVYGSDEETAESLRGPDGKLLLDENGWLLPSEETGVLAGDVRAAENVALTTLHTVFAREHNRWVDKLSKRDPSLDGDALYEAARARVEAEIQAITFNEFLPILLGPDAIPEYGGYDSSVDPTIAAEFSTVAFRFGHTLLSSTILRLAENGETIEGGNLSLRDAFFAPQEIAENGGIAPVLRGLGEGVAQEMDTMIVEDVRSFLFGEPGSGGLDLASLNIQRGRDLGIPDYNALREALGLERAESFADITSDVAIQQALEATYGSVDDIDPWVGGLAEDAHGGGLLGELFHTIVLDQFLRVRDGDSQWSEEVLPKKELAKLWGTSLSDIIERNSDVGVIQEDAFVAYDRMGGTNEDDVLSGDDGRDLLVGAGGNDDLFGGSDRDHLDGGAGRDRLWGGLGDDDLSGGAGADVFGFEANFGDDTILDFGRGDRIDLSGIDRLSSLSDLESDRVGKDLVLTVGEEGTITFVDFGEPALDPDAILI